uniref:Small ribosomal subunit protein uS7c n=1 Tax=Eutreptiella sp. CCMP389 TaxID=96781 RepID=A0A977K875_9EUGL|nr:ribosomal protein S7 [Eutreptiella sp. CCMP389]
MSRRRQAKKRRIVPDAIYNSTLVSLIINKILKNGKKTVAQQIFYQAMKKVEESVQQDSLEVLRQAIVNITPRVEVKARRVGGSTYQVPLEVKAERGTSLAVRWLVRSARLRPGRKMVSKLSNEIIDAYNNTGTAIRKREETHKMAEANKAFANFRF